MNVRQLIALLGEFPPTTRVIMVRDGEANGASPLDAVQEGVYREETKWSGEIKNPEDKAPGDKMVVALWPTN